MRSRLVIIAVRHSVMAAHHPDGDATTVTLSPHLKGPAGPPDALRLTVAIWAGKNIRLLRQVGPKGRRLCQSAMVFHRHRSFLSFARPGLCRRGTFTVGLGRYSRSQFVDKLLWRCADIRCQKCHQFRFLAVLCEDQAALSATAKPACLQVSRAPTRQQEDAGIRPFHAAQIGHISSCSNRVSGQLMAVFFGGPVLPVRVNLGPRKSGNARRRIAEVIDFVTLVSEELH